MGRFLGTVGRAVKGSDVTRLTNHFTLEEMTMTQVRGADNQPPAGAIMDNILRMSENMERVRALLGVPIHVNSGYRSPFVNAVVGGSPNSAHMSGWACDFVAPAFGNPRLIAVVIRDSDLKFDQLIYEETWVHLSFDPRARREVLTKRAHAGYVAGIRDDNGKEVA